MPKRPPEPKGDTNIRPRWAARRNAWVFDVTYPRWERGFTSLPEARRARNAMRASADAGTLTRGGRMTVGDLVLRRWLPAKQAELSNRYSLYGCKRAAQLIDELLGKIALRKLTPLDVEEKFKQPLTRRFNTATAAQYFDRLREVLKWAIDHDLLHKSPASRVKPPKVVAHKAPALELAQIRTLQEHADATPYGLLVWMAIATGLRISELLTLEWRRVDMAEAVLRISDAKSQSGVRSVALAPVTIERLQSHRLEQIATFTRAELPPPTLLFLNERNRPLKSPHFWWQWNAIRSAALLPDLRFHDLRHVHATLLAQAGVHPSVMQERLGHSTPTMTLDVYTHGSAAQQVDAARAVEGLLSTVTLQKP